MIRLLEETEFTLKCFIIFCSPCDEILKSIFFVSSINSKFLLCSLGHYFFFCKTHFYQRSFFSEEQHSIPISCCHFFFLRDLRFFPKQNYAFCLSVWLSFFQVLHMSKSHLAGYVWKNITFFLSGKSPLVQLYKPEETF